MTTNDNTGEPMPQTHGGKGHNSGGSDRPNLEIVKLSPDHLLLWDPAAEQADDVDQATLEAEVEVLVDAGQRSPVTARRRDDGIAEVVAKGWIVRAVELHNQQHQSMQIEVEVRLFDHMPDEAAYRVLGQDVDYGPATSSLARGQFYGRAVKQFGSETDAANGLRVTKATISKNLDTARCLAFVGKKITIHREIGQRDAMWLMGIVGRKKDGSDVPDAERRTLVIETIESMAIMSAKKVFAALRTALKASEPKKARKGVLPILSGEREIGAVKTKNGNIVIELIAVGDIPLADLMLLVEEAMARTRR